MPNFASFFDFDEPDELITEFEVYVAVAMSIMQVSRLLENARAALGEQQLWKTVAAKILHCKDELVKAHRRRPVQLDDDDDDAAAVVPEPNGSRGAEMWTDGAVLDDAAVVLEKLLEVDRHSLKALEERLRHHHELCARVLARLPNVDKEVAPSFRPRRSLQKNVLARVQSFEQAS